METKVIKVDNTDEQSGDFNDLKLRKLDADIGEPDCKLSRTICFSGGNEHYYLLGFPTIQVSRQHVFMISIR